MSLQFVIMQKRNGMFVQYNEKGERFAVANPVAATRYEAGDKLRIAVSSLNHDVLDSPEFAAVSLEDVPFYLPRGEWMMTKIHDARALAEALGIKNVSRFTNQISHMRSLADLGKLEELHAYVLEIKASQFSISYPNSYTYFSG